jgi:flavin reductase (DIM6/NTAB) family NADH-FMN oxidoreductase RutF
MKPEINKILGPRAVIFITTKAPAGYVHIAPFSWVCPADSSNVFIVMMRETSTTLRNIESGRSKSVIVSLLNPSPRVAQNTLLSHSSKPVNMCTRNSLYPNDAHTVFDCHVTEILQSLAIHSSTHKMVVLEAARVLKSSPQSRSFNNLMYHHGRLFSSMTNYNVEGY